jgi:ribosome-interacting GTPase 1
MPANLPPQYREVERKFREAKSPDERLTYLREMLAVIPKHKGTEKLQADLKRRISRLQLETQKARKAGRRPYAFTVEREGAAQVVLLGPPNSGKSSILRALTRAEPEVASYPFTTRRPLPGMMHFEDIQIQLVDLPAISEVGMEHWIPQIIRNADAALCVLDVGAPNVLEEMETVEKVLADRGIYLGAGPAEQHQGPVPAVEQEPEIEPVLSGPSASFKKTLVIANKMDRCLEQETLGILEEALGERPARLGPLKLVSFSAAQPEKASELGREVFELVDIIRVYTKIPGKKPDMNRPFVLPVGSTLMEVATLVHKDFVLSLKFARVWGSGAFDGQCVQKDHVLRDRDIVELHM